MGVNYVAHDFQVEQANRRDIKLSHFFRYIEQAEASVGTVSQASYGARVKAQLEMAGSDRDAYYHIIRDGFLAHLRRLLRITDGERALGDASTLVAVDIQTWFRKELDVDLPTIKVLSGGCIADLVRETQDKTKSPAHTQERQDISLAAGTYGGSTSASLGAVNRDVLIHPIKTESPSYTQSSPHSSPTPIFTPVEPLGTRSGDVSTSPPPPLGDDLRQLGQGAS